MKLEEYTSFEEKGKFFKNGELKITHNIETIFEKIKEFQEIGTSWVYRGSGESKYKMYNSAQRLYINQELHKQVPEDRISEHYRKFITELIAECKEWNNGVVVKLIKNSGINENNSIALLSYMQHYGVPTPFLDFSFNPYVALFFAIDSISYHPSDNEIDNYFSLYYTYTDATAFHFWKGIFDDKIKSESISYETIDENDMGILIPDKEFYKIMNSVNIINQEGLFFYNNHPWYPIERTYSEYIEWFKNEVGHEKFNELKMLNTFSGCFNIHKSLVPAIKEKLKEFGITKEYIYPNMDKFKEEVKYNGILNSLTLKK